MFQDRLTQERYIIQKRPTKKTFKLYLMDRTWGTAYVCMHEDVLIYIRHIRLHIHETFFMYTSMYMSRYIYVIHEECHDTYM